MDEKPSRNEDEYFARENAELLKRNRAEAEREAEKAARRQHHMKCPKCGADLSETAMHGVKVDVCPECRGIWFDAGELDQMKPEDRNPIRAGLREFISGLKR